MVEKDVAINEQWKIDGDCNLCRRKNYCGELAKRGGCTAKKRLFAEAMDYERLFEMGLTPEAINVDRSRIEYINQISGFEFHIPEQFPSTDEANPSEESSDLQ